MAELLTRTNARQGYAVVDQPRDLAWLLALVQQTQFHIIALLDDPQTIAALRERLRVNGVLGRRVAVVSGNLQTVHLPPYLAELVVADKSRVAAPSGAEYLANAFAPLRPYSGVALLPCEKAQQSTYSASLSGLKWEAALETAETLLIVRRTGPLPGAGTWTSQNGDAGNTLVSAETNVKTPLGVLWFGGPSNREVLPRHGHGPVPQVIGGRLFIEGRDMLRAVDVYTGRLLWQREFKDVGIFYDNDRSSSGGRCDRWQLCVHIRQRVSGLGPALLAAGSRHRRRRSPNSRYRPTTPVQQPYWGYLGVLGDHLVAGSSPMLLLARAPGEKLDEEDKEQLKREVPLFSPFGEGSHRLVVMDRWSGQVQWTRDAQYDFRHNAIAIGDGKVFCLDRMIEKRLAHFRRRGTVPVADYRLYALDLETGDVVWQSTEHARLGRGWPTVRRPGDCCRAAARTGIGPRMKSGPDWRCSTGVRASWSGTSMTTTAGLPCSTPIPSSLREPRTSSPPVPGRSDSIRSRAKNCPGSSLAITAATQRLAA